MTSGGKLLDSADFLPHRECGHWSSLHLGAHLVADGAIFVACLMAVVLVGRGERGQAAVGRVMGTRWRAAVLFCILLLGSVQLLQAVVFFYPVYRLLGLLKLGVAACTWSVVLGVALRSWRERQGPPQVTGHHASSDLLAVNDQMVTTIKSAEAASNTRELEHRLAELERINADLDDFAAAAAHDLKAPLRAIRNTATWLEEDLPASAWNDETREHMRLLKSRALRMDTLLDTLLQYARSTHTELSPEQFSVDGVVDDTVLLLGEQAKRAVIVEQDLPVLFTARAPFERVLYNLIANAIKHARGKPDLTVRVTARSEGEGYIFDVADNGPGIPSEYFERIFEVFATLRPRDEVEGAGMGLALVKKVVESHGGRVTVKSALGHGTTFSFYWPKTFP